MPPHSRFLAPAPVRLRDTAVQVLALLDSTGLDMPDNEAHDWMELIGFEVDANAGRMASARAHDAAWGQSGSLAMMLARVAVAVTFNPILTFHAPQLTRHVAAWTATCQTAELASTLGYQLDMAAQCRFATMLEQATRPATAVPDAVTLLTGSLTPDNNPNPRVIFLTPLTHITAAEQERLLQVATAASDQLTELGYDVDIPGERLGPDDHNPWPPQLMYGMERQRILGSSLVVILADAHHSYGAGQCQSWAESVGIDALVFSTHPSRAVGDGYWRTQTEPFTTQDEVIATVTTHARGRQAAHRRQAASSAKRRRDWVDSILLPAPPVLDSAVSDWLPSRRLDALASSPLELETLSVAEIRLLRERPPADAGPILRAIGEPEPQIEAGFLVSGGLMAHRIDASTRAAPPLNSESVRRVLAGHAMHMRMNAGERDDFVALALAADLDEVQLEVALNHGLELLEDTAAFHRIHAGREFWVAVLRRLRGLQ